MADIKKSIRRYKTNDPYYYEVDNLPIRELQSNDLILESKMLDLSANVFQKYATTDFVNSIAADITATLNRWAGYHFLDTTELFGSNTTGVVYTQTEADAKTTSEIENRILRTGETVGNYQENVLDEFARENEIPLIDGVIGDGSEAALIAADDPQTSNPYSTITSDLEARVSLDQAGSIITRTPNSLANPVLGTDKDFPDYTIVEKTGQSASIDIDGKTKITVTGSTNLTKFVNIRLYTKIDDKDYTSKIDYLYPDDSIAFRFQTENYDDNAGASVGQKQSAQLFLPVYEWDSATGEAILTFDKNTFVPGGSVTGGHHRWSYFIFELLDLP